MRRVVIFGNNKFAEEVAYFIEADSKDEVVAYTLDGEYVNENSFCGRPLIPYENLSSIFSKDEIEIIVAIGYSEMNRIRRLIFEKCEKDGWKIGGFCHSSVDIYDAQIGIGNIIFDGVQIRHHSKLGKGNIILAKSIISHDTQIGDFNYFAGSVHILGCSCIGDENFLGNSIIVTDNVAVGNANLIGAGSIVSSTVEDNCLIAPPVPRKRKLNPKMINMMLMKRL